MALIGKKLAIASVGISCQPAHQIYANAGLIRDLAGDSLRTHVTPFDWLLVSAGGVASMIEDSSFYPAAFDGPMLDPKPFWPRYGAHFWHAKTGNVADFVSKHAHTAENWDLISTAPRMIFVVADTQNNVTRALVDAGREPIEARLTFEAVDRLYRALRKRFGVGAELHAVTRAGFPAPPMTFVADEVYGRPAISIHRIGEDGSQWAGDTRAWQALFKRII